VKHRLGDLDHENSWLHNMVRKHRKSFSYLEHIILTTALTDAVFGIGDALDRVITIDAKNESSKTYRTSSTVSRDIDQDKKRWMELLKSYGVKRARGINGALYAALYRTQHSWLMRVNKMYRRPATKSGNLIDWDKRDLGIVKQLIRIRNASELNIQAPRQSKLWFIQQLPYKATIEKNLYKLPLTAMFLERYQESVAEYQIRRLAREMAHLPSQPFWQLLRRAGLSKEKMRQLTKLLCSEIGITE